MLGIYHYKNKYSSKFPVEQKTSPEVLFFFFFLGEDTLISSYHFKDVP